MPEIQSTCRDIGAAFRYLRRKRGLFASAVVILALGIGATTAAFSVAEALLLREPAYPASDRLVTLRSVDTLRDDQVTRVAPGLLADWQSQARSFESMTGYRWATVDLIDGTESDRLSGLLATPEFFDVFGVSLLGRSFLPEDKGTKRQFESTASGETLVLGHQVWRRRFDSDAALVGKTVDLYVLNFSRPGPTRQSVVGVAIAPVRFPPLEADFQLGDSSVIEKIDFWMPQFVSPTQLAEPGPRDAWFDVVARLRPGVTPAQAQAEMDVLASIHAEQFPETNRGRGVRVVTLQEHMAGDSRSGTMLLSLATAMLLLIACSNVATLLLAHGMARRSEVATRLALGASEWRVVQPLLVESSILATFAGLLGLSLAGLALKVARPWMPQSLPVLQEAGINPTVLAFALAIVIVTACVTGVAPALQSTRADSSLAGGLRGRGLTPGKLHSRLVGVLVSAEVALTIVLLVGAGLLVRSAFQAGQVETGFNQSNLLTMTISLPANKFEWDHNAVFAREVLQEVRSLPMISDAAVVHGIPMRSGGYVSDGTGKIEDYIPANDSEKPIYGIRIVSPDYFATMQIPIVAGRAFEPRDEEGQRGAARSILVSDSFAKRYWPGRDPLGRRISFGEDPEDWQMTVVGVVGDVRYSGLEMSPTADIYLPQALFPQSAITLVARTRSDPLTEARSVRDRVLAVDRHAFVSDVQSMDQLIAGAQARRRAGTVFVLVFGVIALVLVVVGVYSVIARMVVERRRDFAIRAALGARRRRIIAGAMQGALQPAAVGMLIGGLAALATTRVMKALLFKVGPMDIMAWTGAYGTLLVACLAAGFMSGRRATELDPMAALRGE